MSLKGQQTTSDYLEWNRLQLLLLQLERDRQDKFCLLIAIGSYTGLRISDILSLRWENIMYTSQIQLNEQKTAKHRKIELHADLIKVIERCYKQQPVNELVFINKHQTSAISIQYVNRKLKSIFSHYDIQGNYSSHFMRKTLGRRVWNQNNHSDKSLFMLSQLFNHSSIQTTKIYLGIREVEIQNIYLNL